MLEKRITIKILRYSVIGGSVATALYFIPHTKLGIDEILLVSILSSVITLFIDTYLPVGTIVI